MFIAICGHTSTASVLLHTGSAKIEQIEFDNGLGTHDIELDWGRFQFGNLTVFTATSANIIQINEGVLSLEISNFQGSGPTVFGVNTTATAVQVSVGNIIYTGTSSLVQVLQSTTGAFQFQISSLLAGTLNYFYYSGGFTTGAGSFVKVSAYALSTITTGYVNDTSAKLLLGDTIAYVKTKPETGADANVLTYTPLAVPAFYRVNVNIDCSIWAANMSATLTYKDSNGSTVSKALVFTDLTTGLPVTVVAATGNYGVTFPFDTDNSATNIVIAVTGAAGNTYKISAALEQLG